MKHIEVTNNNGKEQLISIDLATNKLSNNTTDGAEIKLICEDNSFQQVPTESGEMVNPINPSPDDIQLVRIRWWSSISSYELFVKYLESQTDDSFKDVNTLIAKTLAFMSKTPANVGCPNLITFEKGDFKKEIVPDSYFSPYQQQGGIIDIHYVIGGMMNSGTLKFIAPAYSTTVLTLY